MDEKRLGIVNVLSFGGTQRLIPFILLFQTKCPFDLRCFKIPLLTQGLISYFRVYCKIIFNFIVKFRLLTNKSHDSDPFLVGVDVLGDKKKRRESWDMGFKGDYMDFQNNKSLQKVISKP